MRIQSGNTTTYAYFVAWDAADRLTRETGLTTFTVKWSRNGGAFTTISGPTVAEIGNGLYAVLISEGTTIDSSRDTEEMALEISHGSMATVNRTIELFRRDVTSGRTLDVSAGGEAGIDLANVGSPTTTLNLSGLTIKNVTDVATTLTTIAGYLDTEVAAILADTTNIKTRIPAALVSGRMDSSVGAMASATLTATAIASDAFTSAKFASDFLTAAKVASDVGTEIATAVWANGTRTLSAAPYTVGDIADAVHDEVVEGSYTLRQLARLWNAVLLARADGMDTPGTGHYRDLANTKDRITVTHDKGNRTSFTYDAT